MKLTRQQLIAKLKSIRERAIADGMKLLTMDEINEEVASRRGGTATMQLKRDEQINKIL
jgi:hypothetical protein